MSLLSRGKIQMHTSLKHSETEKSHLRSVIIVSGMYHFIFVENFDSTVK